MSKKQVLDRVVARSLKGVKPNYPAAAPLPDSAIPTAPSTSTAPSTTTGGGGGSGTPKLSLPFLGSVKGSSESNTGTRRAPRAKPVVELSSSKATRQMVGHTTIGSASTRAVRGAAPTDPRPLKVRLPRLRDPPVSAADTGKDGPLPKSSSSSSSPLSVDLRFSAEAEQLRSLKDQIVLAARVSDWAMAMELVCRHPYTTSPSKSEAVGGEGTPGVQTPEVNVTSSTPPATGAPTSRTEEGRATVKRLWCECIGTASEVCAEEEEEECVAWLLAHPMLNPTTTTARGVSSTQFLRLAAAAEAVGSNSAILTLFTAQYMTPHRQPPKPALAAAMCACDRMNDWERALFLTTSAIESYHHRRSLSSNHKGALKNDPAEEEDDEEVQGVAETTAKDDNISSKDVDAVVDMPMTKNDEKGHGDEAKSKEKEKAPQRFPDVVGGEAYAVLLSLLDRSRQKDISKELLKVMPKKDQRAIAKAYTALIGAWSRSGTH